MRYTLATIKQNGKHVPAIGVQERFYALELIAPELILSSPSAGLSGLFDDWENADRILGNAAELLAQSSDRGMEQPALEDFLAPVLYPKKLMLGGANYYEHMHKEANKPDFRKEDGTPVFFMKPPSTSLVGSGKSVRYPSQSEKFDWEIELAVVVGRKLRNASIEEAKAGIAGFTIGIDLSARDWQMSPKHPWKFDLFTGKAFDDSCPIGPLFVPARFVDSENLQLQLWVNGELKQDAHTSDMIWSPQEQLAEISQHLTIEPGDILLTGTPAGVGMVSNTYLSVGDVIDAKITGLGHLQVTIISGSAKSAA